MPSAKVFLPVISFTVAALVMWGWPAAPIAAGTATPKLPDGPSSRNLPASRNQPEPSAALLQRLGLSAKPSLDEVFAVEGVDRDLRMTLFIQSATSAELAEALARADEDGSRHSGLLDQIWLRWAEVDPAAAVASSSNWGQAWWAWAKADPQAALAAAQGNKDNLIRVIRSIGDGDPAWARRLIAEFPQADQPMVWDGILESLTKQDPAAAATLAMERKANLKGVLDDWTTRQPDDARAWIEALPDGSAKRKAMETFVRKRCAMDPAAGIPEAVNLPPGQGRDAILTAAVTGLAIHDAAAATAAAEKLPPGVGRQQALGALAEKWFADDPAKALQVLSQVSWGDMVPTGRNMWRYYTKEGGSGTGFSSEPGISEPPLSAKGALEKLVDHDASNTLQALAALPAEREAPLADAVWQWSGKAPEAASAWLRDQPAGEARDRGIGGLVRRLTGPEDTDFVAALTWADSATPAARDKLLRKALNSYSISDQPAAAAAAEKLGIQPGPMAKYSPKMPY